MSDRTKAPAGFLLRIELMEILPPIWRRFLVPVTITLPDLHHVMVEWRWPSSNPDWFDPARINRRLQQLSRRRRRG